MARRENDHESESLSGNATSNYLYGRGGDDTLHGHNGDASGLGQWLVGDAGNDSIIGGSGADRLVGGFDGFERDNVPSYTPLPGDANYSEAKEWVETALTQNQLALNSFLFEPHTPTWVGPFVDFLTPGNTATRYTLGDWNEFVARTVQSVAGGRPGAPPGQTTNWKDPLPESPPTASAAGVAGWTQFGEGLDKLREYHPGANLEFRIPDNATGRGQQATYYDGKLITDGPGAGTPDLSSPTTNPDAIDHHAQWDVVPSKVLEWWLYHDLGWTPKNPSGAEEYWGFDGSDTLNGGKGTDTYVFGVGGANDLGFHVSSGQDTIQDAGVPNESDSILIYGAELDLKSGIEDYLKFTPTKDDLKIDFSFGEDYEEGSVIIKNMNDPAHQVERLDLVRGDYVLSLDLVEKFNGQEVIAMGDNQVPSIPGSPPPASDTVQDLGTDKPSGVLPTPPPPPDVPPPPPPSFSPGSAPEPGPRPEPGPGVQDLGGAPPTGSTPKPGPRPEPPASDTVQDLGGDKPSGDGTTGNEKIAFSDLPPPPDTPPPPPPSFSPGSAPESDARSEAPSHGTVQDLGGDTPTVPHMDLSSPHVLDDILIT